MLDQSLIAQVTLAVLCFLSGTGYIPGIAVCSIPKAEMTSFKCAANDRERALSPKNASSITGCDARCAEPKHSLRPAPSAQHVSPPCLCVMCCVLLVPCRFMYLPTCASIHNSNTGVNIKKPLARNSIN
ncbi:hypothetical protein B0T17DRAFT_537184 [Bombardia bombarda]|uniref:Uncharacterized protein n=1 Tax=Bombardia bombarda TaxID=252184 RepID=A0AA39WMK8_9PEZI|nr:hypothetical protein B0T17DRAFT_537184 [Bombardia bombarda]